MIRSEPFNYFCVVFFLIIFCIFTCNDRIIVARVGNHIITAEEFNRFLLYNVTHVKLFSTHGQRLTHLDRMIDSRLMLTAAFDYHLDSDSILLRKLKYYERKAVNQYVREQEILEKAIPDHLVKAEYDKMGKQVRLRHIFLAVDKNDDDSIEVFSQIKQLRSRILHGEDFGEIAGKFSQDTVSAKNGGDLGYIRWGYMGLGDNFFKAAFDLARGRISQPIKTPMGYHLILVEGIRHVAKPSFDELKDDIRRQFFGSMENEIEKCEQTFMARVRQHFQEDTDDDELITRWGYENNYQKTGKIKRFLEEFKHSLMISMIEKTMIYEKLPDLTEEDYRKYYFENRDKYFFPEQKKVQEIFVKSEDLAKEIARRARENEDFDNLAARYNERVYTKRSNGVLGFINASQQGEIGKRASLMQVGEISEPVKSKLGFSIIRVLDKKPKRQRTFIEAKRIVEQDLSASIIDSCRTLWLNELRQKTNVDIYEGTLKRAFPD